MQSYQLLVDWVRMRYTGKPTTEELSQSDKLARFQTRGLLEGFTGYEPTIPSKMSFVKWSWWFSLGVRREKKSA
jgi:hypothetical protein